jgi:hypothetical protein
MMKENRQHQQEEQGGQGDYPQQHLNLLLTSYAAAEELQQQQGRHQLRSSWLVAAHNATFADAGNLSITSGRTQAQRRYYLLAADTPPQRSQEEIKQLVISTVNDVLAILDEEDEW